ncbi:MAG: hypothetical protein LLG09_09510 [Negativicutes bacterium]|nr:hypothetical protein [Negativicutes bacterium]
MNTVVYAGLTDLFADIGTLQIVLFLLGLALLFVEIFIPGFGIAGGSGILLLIVGILMTAQTPLQAVVMILILLLLLSLLLFAILHSAKKGKLSKKLILKSASKREDGYSSTSDHSALLGKDGIALSLLRPAGIGEFDGQRLDVVSEGRFIEPGTKIRIVETAGSRIVVKPIE